VRAIAAPALQNASSVVTLPFVLWVALLHDVQSLLGTVHFVRPVKAILYTIAVPLLRHAPMIGASELLRVARSEVTIMFINSVHAVCIMITEPPVEDTLTIATVKFHFWITLFRLAPILIAAVRTILLIVTKPIFRNADGKFFFAFH
jgi:hypothetical protein